MSEMCRIYVDFNTKNADPEGRVTIPTHVCPELLDFLKPGLRVVLYTTNDVEVEAILEQDEGNETSPDDWKLRRWYGVPDLTTLRYYDEKTGQYLPPNSLSSEG